LISAMAISGAGLAVGPRNQQTLAEIFVGEPVWRLIGDNAYDPRQPDRELAQTSVEMIAPHRSNPTKPTQDGRPLRRYRRRWKAG